MARTVFAAEAGVVGARLLNCELGVTPLSYGLFKAINHRFFVRPAWLVYNNGAVCSDEPFEAGDLASKIKDRELLSSACDNLFRPLFEKEEKKAEDKISGENGLMSSLNFMRGYLKDPANKGRIPKIVLRQAAEAVDRLLAVIEPDLSQREAVESSLRRLSDKTRRKRRA